MKPLHLFAAALAVCSVPVSAAGEEAIVTAVAADDRSAEHRELDSSRKPVDVLQFLGLKEGMVAADFLPGTGYYSVIMAKVVGDEGKVVGMVPALWVEGSENVKKAWTELPATYGNIELDAFDWASFAPAADSFDFMMLHLVYHDIYWESERFRLPRNEPDDFVAKLFSAMKPGGIVAVVDHVGEAGETRTVVDKTHRIDPQVIKDDFTRAGFVLEAEGDMLRNPEDDISVLVFDPSVRGKTDRVVLKFRKP